MKILSEIYLRIRKTMLHFGRHSKSADAQGYNNFLNNLITTDHIFMKILPEMYLGIMKTSV